MIPIEYDSNKPLKEYNDFLRRMKSSIKNSLSKGYIGNLVSKSNRKGSLKQYKKVKGTNKYSKFIIDDETKLFLKFLTIGNRYDSLIDKGPEYTEKYIHFMDINFPEYRNQDTQFYKNIYKIFVTDGYERLSSIKKEILHAINSDVCPYCNASFIRSKFVNGKIQGELDHFYPKDIYPFLAVFKYNLVPSCAMCNGHAGKFKKDTFKNRLVNPYTLETDEGLIFRARLNGKNLTTLKDLEDNIEIDVTCPDKRMEVNRDTFNLEEIYGSRTDLAAEIYKKKKFFSSVHYLKGVVSFIFKNTTLFGPDAERIITGVYMSPKDFGKRPLSKFVHDLYMYPWTIKR